MLFLNYGCVIILIIQLVNIKNVMNLSTNSLLSMGCTAYDCKRNCFASDVTQTPGDNGFSIKIEGSPTKYIPNKDYKSKLIWFSFFFERCMID